MNKLFLVLSLVFATSSFAGSECHKRNACCGSQQIVRETETGVRHTAVVQVCVPTATCSSCVPYCGE